MATAALLSVAAPAFLLTPAAEATVAPVVAEQSVPGNLIANHHHHHHKHNNPFGHQIHRGHKQKHRQYYQYNPFRNYQTPQVIYRQPVGIYAPSPVIYVPHHQKCVRTLYSTICN
jgi:hypothetical protein